MEVNPILAQSTSFPRGASPSPRPQWRSDVHLVSRNGEAARRVLVVDDDVNLMRLLVTILRTAGFDVLAASDGYKAVEMAGVEKPDVVILDLRMPVLDGRATYRALRERGVDSPVLIASAYGARAAQMELGAQGYIEKPFDPENLIDAVQELVPSS